MSETQKCLKGKRRKRVTISFVGVPTSVLLKELERRNSLAYHRNVNREFRARGAAACEGTWR